MYSLSFASVHLPTHAHTCKRWWVGLLNVMHAIMAKLRLRLVVVLSLAIIYCQAGSEISTQPSHIEVYKAGDLGYECFRIPSLLFTSRGTLLAFAEGRGQHSKSCADRGDVHIVLKRSSDYGNTWSDMTVVHIEANHTVGRQNLISTFFYLVPNNNNI